MTKRIGLDRQLVILCLLLSFATSCANKGETDKPELGDSLDSNLAGRILLPGGSARGGIELRVAQIASNGELIDRWLHFDEQGYFSYALEGELDNVTITAGSAEVYRVSREELPGIDEALEFDLGTVDLRDRLQRHGLTVRAAEGESSVDIRVAMWFGLPPVGPAGGRVSLGSKQFPTVRTGSEQEWLLPLDAESIYFLVERAAESQHGDYWNSGEQNLFGPFTSSTLPTELELD